ncbi:MAG: hypothetical protein HY815_03150 [Candidatus Riflebacteria bacterium]|nr:hypothetical protein [Candidatus Riflebacteria bacterium]
MDGPESAGDEAGRGPVGRPGASDRPTARPTWLEEGFPPLYFERYRRYLGPAMRRDGPGPSPFNPLVLLGPLVLIIVIVLLLWKVDLFRFVAIMQELRDRV